MNFTLIENQSYIVNFQNDLILTDIISLDTETTSLDELEAVVRLLQVKINNKIYIFDLKKLGYRYLEYIISLISDTNKLIIIQNARYDLQVIKNNTNIMLKNVHDTMIAEVMILNGIGRRYFSLLYLVDKYCNITIDKSEQESFVDNLEDDFTLEQLEYAANDVEYLEEIYHKQLDLIKESKQLEAYQIDMEFIPVVSDMMLNGILLDSSKWLDLDTQSAKKYEDVRKEVLDYFIKNIDWKKFNNLADVVAKIEIRKDEAGKSLITKKSKAMMELITDLSVSLDFIKRNINLNSPSQLKNLLHLVGIEVESTNKKVLKELKDKFPILVSAIEMGMYDKKDTSYGTKFLEHIHPKTGRIHSDIHPFGALSGRTSSKEPNMQNIPRESDYRECFVAPKGKKIIVVDYNQQEYRLAGDISGDEVIIEAYANGVDMHTSTATTVTRKSIAEIVKEERNLAKSVNFAILYGSTEWGLSYNLGIPIEEARSMLESVREGYPTLTPFMNRFQDTVLDKGYSVTLTGRRRYFRTKGLYIDKWEYRKEIRAIRREGFNHLIQGSGADMLKMACNYIYYNNPFGDKLKLILIVHDEIVAEVDNEIAEGSLDFIIGCMLNAESRFLKSISPAVDGDISDRWIKK